MGIDIRDDLQIECINCGRCLDACRAVMGRRGGKGLIHYSFGSLPEGVARPLNRRALLLAGFMVLLVALLAFGVATRKEATLKVQRAGNGEVKTLPDGSLVNFYAVYLENRATRPGSFSLEAGPMPGYRVELIGPVREMRLEANANRRADLALKLSPAPPVACQVEVRLLQNGRIVAVASLPVLTK